MSESRDNANPVGRLPSAGADAGCVPPRGASPSQPAAASADVKNSASGDAAYNTTRPADVGRLPPAGVVVGHVPSRGEHEFSRIKRAWRWQEGFHDRKFRTPESEARKWGYVCLNPVRYGLVQRPEQWPYGGEIFYGEAGGPRLVRGTAPVVGDGDVA